MAISIGRLSGGNTPADGSDPRTFPAIWNATADTLEGLSNTVDGLEVGDLADATVTSPVAGEKLVYDGNEWVNLEAYALVETVYFTSNGTFAKDDFPFLRAIRVKCQGAGGGGGNRNGTSQCGGGGSGGGYAESFITDVAGLDASVTVTVGAAGSGGATGAINDGDDGGDSSFGATVVGDGGGGTVANATLPGTPGGGTGDVVFSGGSGDNGSGAVDLGGGIGGSSHLGGAGRGGRFGGNAGLNGRLHGGGGGGASENNGGGSGADGIVIVELFA